MLPKTQDQVPSERLLRLPEVQHRTGRRKSAIYAGMAAGTFPMCIKVGRSSLWPSTKIDAWIADRIRESREVPVTTKPGARAVAAAAA